MVHKEFEENEEESGIGDGVLSDTGVEDTHLGEDRVDQGTTPGAQEVQDGDTLVQTLGKGGEGEERRGGGKRKGGGE